MPSEDDLSSTDTDSPGDGLEDTVSPDDSSEDPDSPDEDSDPDLTPSLESTENGASTGSEALSADLAFDALKNRRRRFALWYLAQAEGPVELSELAEQVAAWENDTTVDAISTAERKRAYTALYRAHLPKLDEADIVDYDQTRGVVTLNEPVASQLQEHTKYPLVDSKQSPVDVAPGLSRRLRRVVGGTTPPNVEPPVELSTRANTRDSDDSANISLDLVFDVLKNRRRRYALRYLTRADGTAPLSELAEQVAAWENDTTVDGVSAAERKRVYTALYQSHLPKLDDAGVVDYNQNRGRVTLNPDEMARVSAFAPWSTTRPRTNWRRLAEYALGFLVVVATVSAFVLPPQPLTSAVVVSMPVLLLALLVTSILPKTGWSS